MSLDSVRAFMAANAPEIEVLVTEASTATVPEAAAAHGVEPGQIAKTLSLWLKDEAVLLVLAGDARIDNRKYKDRFETKAKMLSADEVLAQTSHPVGGVCPFGLPGDLRIFADQSLRRYEMIIPAAGAPNASLKITPDQMAALVGAEWVDVAQE
jgi:prolyl-tRNA editing enzyme YbaK/EbsC (Cys-tRNA(Pro) deacylase)